MHRDAELAQDLGKVTSCRHVWLLWHVKRMDLGGGRLGAPEGCRRALNTKWRVHIMSFIYWTEYHVMFIMLFNLFRLHFSVNNIGMLIYATKQFREQMWGLMTHGVWSDCLFLLYVLAEVNPFQIARVHFLYYLFFFFLVCFLFRAIPEAYGGSQAKGQIRAATAGHSRSNSGSELCLPPTLQLMEMLDP